MLNRSFERQLTPTSVSSPMIMPPANIPLANANVWIVVPAYNEQPRLEKSLSTLVGGPWNVVVVDDGSTDRTHEIARRYPVWVLKHPVNCGQGAALKTGFDFALENGAEVIVTYDADGQHDAREIEALVTPIVNGEVDVVLGSRFLGETYDMPWSRWAILKAGIVFTKYFSGISLTDTHNGFRAFSRSAIEQIQITHPRMAYASEILEEIVRHGISYKEVPVTITYSRETLTKGQSSWEAFRITGHLLTGRYLR